MSTKHLLVSEDKDTIGIEDANGKRHWWNRCTRPRQFCRSSLPEPLTSVALHSSHETPEGCDCSIKDHTGITHFCVGSYGGCARFQRGTM